MAQTEAKAGEDVLTRGRLLDAAASLFAAKGYAATSVREIVLRAGVTKPVLYYYFESKEGIFRALVEAAFLDFEAMVVEVERGAQPPPAKLRLLFDRCHRMFVERLDLARLVHSLQYGPPQGAPPADFTRIPRRLDAAVRGILAEGVGSGELRRRDLGDMTRAALAMLHAALDAELVPAFAGESGRDSLQRQLTLLFEGIGAGPAAAAPALETGP